MQPRPEGFPVLVRPPVEGLEKLPTTVESVTDIAAKRVAF